MRSSRGGLASPSSPDQTPPRRSKSRKPWTPRCLSFDEPEENSQVNVLPQPTESRPKIWNPHLWEPSNSFKKQNEKMLTNAFSATISARVNAFGLNNRREELLMPCYRPLTPEPDDEPPLLLLDSAPDMFSTEPVNLVLDEQVAYDYSMHSRWVSELTESERNDISYDEQGDGPSTSARALELLLELQDSVWMCRPNFALPQRDATKSVAEETTVQQLSDKSRQELEELRQLEELRELEELKKLEELRELEELKKLEELRQLEELRKLEELRELEELDELKKLEELKELEELRELEKLKQKGELEGIKELKELEPNAAMRLMNIMRLFKS